MSIKQAKHLVYINYMGIADKINKLRKGTKQNNSRINDKK
jgi:hypothetical protein